MSEIAMLSAHGGRRLSLAMLALRERADRFPGAAPGATPLRFLAAFQEAESYLGLPPQTFRLVAWLVKMTRPRDWEAGSRPIAWPSAARQQEFLGLTASAVKTLNRALFAAGVFVLRDSPTGKRYGRRDGEGRIVEAYGFDLSPLAFRAEEFIVLAAQARAERERRQRLKRRLTCARRALAAIGEAFGPAPPAAWPALAASAAEGVAAIRKARTSAELTRLTEALEGLQAQAQSWAAQAPNTANTGPVGPADRPHIISTDSDLNPSDTVMATDESSRPAPPPPKPASVRPEELLHLAPRLAAYVAAPHPDWREIVDAAGVGLRPELGVSPSLWGEACAAVGRPLAAVALAIVSTKPPAHFRRGAGGYFAAMIKRAGTGELHLDRSLWKLRRDRLDALADRGRALPPIKQFKPETS